MLFLPCSLNVFLFFWFTDKKTLIRAMYHLMKGECQAKNCRLLLVMLLFLIRSDLKGEFVDEDQYHNDFGACSCCVCSGICF
jgi:hypothetical protein